jgi:hypothetical protein
MLLVEKYSVGTEGLDVRGLQLESTLKCGLRTLGVISQQGTCVLIQSINVGLGFHAVKHGCQHVGR